MESSSTKRRLLARGALVATCGIAALAATASAMAADGLRAVSVDASRQVGTIRSLQGVAGSPVPGDGSHGDYTAQHHQLGVNLVRTHDIDCSGTGDIDGNGPNRIFKNWSADPADPASYNFGPTDRAILSIVGAGEQVEFNVGHSDLSCAGAGFNNTPPPDLAKWAKVVRHVVRHYNDGWAAGYRLGIRYWEIWNEPDLVPFWSGTREQFYALYAATARALKSVHPSLEVGGPALTTNNDLTGFRESLLAYIRAQHLPLDFWSFHHYSDFTEDPLDFTRIADQMRTLLDTYGFRRTAIDLTEWNYGLAEQPSPMQRSAYISSSLILMQDSPIRNAAYYRSEGAGPSWQLISSDGTLTKPGHAFEAVGAMQRTPRRLAVSGGDDQGFSVEAGRSRNAGAVQVLLSNYQVPAADQGPLPFPDNLFSIPGIATFSILDRRALTYADNNGYDLTVTGLRGRGRKYSVSRYRVDETHDLTLVAARRGAAATCTSRRRSPRRRSSSSSSRRPTAATGKRGGGRPEPGQGRLRRAGIGPSRPAIRPRGSHVGLQCDRSPPTSASARRSLPTRDRAVGRSSPWCPRRSP